MWYNVIVPRGTEQKPPQKKEKKHLTNSSECDIIKTLQERKPKIKPLKKIKKKA
jgi:hypothetical protein